LVSVFATNGVGMGESEQRAGRVPEWGPVGPPPGLWREPDEIVAGNVRRVRKLRGLSGRELEERAGLRGRYVSDLERGRLKGGPSVSDVVRIALALSVSPLALVVPWDEDEDGQHVMYVRQGTFGVLFPSGTAGVMAAARLWTGLLDPAFATFVNVREYETTIPHGYTRDRGDVGTGRVVLEDGSVRVPDFLGAGPATLVDEDGLRFAVLDNGMVLPIDGSVDEWGRETEETTGDEWTTYRVELLEDGPLYEQLRAAREEQDEPNPFG